MPPPYLVDIDGHPHPLKGQNVVLDIIRPSSCLKANEQEEPEALVDYDEFMKQRQAQLSHGKMKISMNSLLRSNDSDHVHENNRDTCNHADKPYSSGKDSGQCCSNSQESEIIDQISNSVLMDGSTKTGNGDLHSGSNGNVELTRNWDSSKESNGVNQDESQCNNHSSLSNGHSLSDHQDFTNQSLTSDQQSINDQQVINGQEMTQVVNLFNGQQSRSCHQSAINDQEQLTSSQETVNNQPAVNSNQSIAAALNNSNDDINIMEFDSADQPAGTSSNNNILTSIVWSCGLSDQEAKNAVSLWLSRTIIPEIDPDLYR